MKRGRNSTASVAKRRRRNNAGEVIYKGPSFSDLPSNILVSILLRLSIKRIFVCKSVCKTWFSLISDPEFAKLHFDQAQVYPLVRTSGFTILSRMLYLVQPEQDDFQCMRVTRAHKLDSYLKLKLDSKLKLPLRNIEMILDKEGAESKNCMKLNMKNHKYSIVNSCNGLLCLSNPSDNEPVIVCNPVTGEFINLPRTVNDHSIDCALGFSPKTNQYKVIRIFTRWSGGGTVMVVEVHVLGTESWKALQIWKDLQFLPSSMWKLSPTYLNGCVYWLRLGRQCSLISFDFEKECFELISVPSEMRGRNGLVEIGVLGGELFISEAFGYDILDFWVMKDNGVEKSWSHIFSFPPGDFDRWPYGSYQPITYLNNGALFLFHSHKHAFICKHPKKTGFRYFKLRGFESKVEVIPHIPSFVSLKHALSGHKVEVLNIKSRCAELKLHREGKGISIVEEDRNCEIDTSEDMDYDSEDREQECDSEARGVEFGSE